MSLGTRQAALAPRGTGGEGAALQAAVPSTVVFFMILKLLNCPWGLSTPSIQNRMSEMLKGGCHSGFERTIFGEGVEQAINHK